MFDGETRTYDVDGGDAPRLLEVLRDLADCFVDRFWKHGSVSNARSIDRVNEIDFPTKRHTRPWRDPPRKQLLHEPVVHCKPRHSSGSYHQRTEEKTPVLTPPKPPNPHPRIPHHTTKIRLPLRIIRRVRAPKRDDYKILARVPEEAAVGCADVVEFAGDPKLEAEVRAGDGGDCAVGGGRLRRGGA